MNTKVIFITLAFLLVFTVAPVAAMWNNGNWVPDDANAKCDYVSYNPGSGVTSCYRDINPAKEFNVMNMQGTLRGSIRCGYNTLTQEIGIRNDVNPDGVNGSFMFIPVLPDGTFEINLIPGEFTLYLPDGNGGQPEYSHVTIRANTISNPTRDLLGHAVSAVEKHTISYVILKASYGGTNCEQVIDVPEHDEYRFWVPAGHCASGHGIGWLLFCGGAWNTHWVDTSHWSAWGDTHPTCAHQTRHVDATYKEVCMGTIVDVASNIQGVVNNGFMPFYFDNAANPGGIFSMGALRSQIDDPAPGIVKHVHISYTRDGEFRTIDTMEYASITL